MKKLLAIIFMASLMGASALSAQETTKEEAFAAAVHEILEQYSAAMLAGESEAWIELWDDNAVEMPKNGLMVEGKERIKNKIETRFRNGTYQIYEIEITAMHVENDTGYVYGNYMTAYTFKGTGVRIDRPAKYLTVLKKQEDGSWKILIDCSNYNR